MMLTQLAQNPDRNQAICDAMDCLDKEHKLIPDAKMLFLFLLKDKIDGELSNLGILSKKLNCSVKQADRYLHALFTKGFLSQSELLEIEKPARLN